MTYLDASPIAPPTLLAHPVGDRVSFDTIVDDAGMRNVVTLMFQPEIRICRGSTDYKVPYPGRAIYCIAENNLPPEKMARAREILRRLAYAFHDYAAREVVARYHRDIKREHGRRAMDPSDARRKNDVTIALRVKAVLRQRIDGATMNEICEMLPYDNLAIERALSGLLQAEKIEIDQNGGERVFRAVSSALTFKR